MYCSKLHEETIGYLKYIINVIIDAHDAKYAYSFTGLCTIIANENMDRKSSMYAYHTTKY